MATHFCFRDCFVKNQAITDKTKCTRVSQVEEAHLSSEMEQWMCSRMAWGHSP